MKKRKGEKIPFFPKLRVMSKAVGSQNKLFKFGGRQDATPTCAASESPNRRLNRNFFLKISIIMAPVNWN